MARWTAGLGWNERFAYNFDHMKWRPIERIYGPRGSVHFRLKPNFILKADAEVMNTKLQNNQLLPGTDASGRGWVWSYFGGMKKEFQFSKGVKGNVQILYNLYDPKDLSPYATRVNVRMGLEFGVREKERKSGDE